MTSTTLACVPLMLMSVVTLFNIVKKKQVPLVKLSKQNTTAKSKERGNTYKQYVMQ